MRQFSAKRDANEAAIVKSLEFIGATVTKLSQKGAPDLLVRYRGVWFLVEVKAPGGKLTEAQKAFDNYHGGCAFIVAHTPEEAIEGVTK